MSNRDVDLGVNPLEDIHSEAAIAYQEQRYENIRNFVRTNSDYYIRNFDKIGASAKFTATFNFMPVYLARSGLAPVGFGAGPCRFSFWRRSGLCRLPEVCLVIWPMML